MITKGIERALHLNRSELRTVKHKSDDDIVTFVSTFNPKNPELFHHYTKLDILLQDEIMRDILSNYDMIKSKRQPPSLKKLLTKLTIGQGGRKISIKKCGTYYLTIKKILLIIHFR